MLGTALGDIHGQSFQSAGLLCNSFWFPDLPFLLEPSLRLSLPLTPSISVEQTLWLHLDGQVKVSAPEGSSVGNVKQPFLMS